MPLHARDQRHLGEGFGAELRLEPRLEGQAGDAKIGAALVLGTAQGRHAGEGDPRPLAARRRAIDAEDIAHAFAEQAERGNQPRLARAHDQHVERRLALPQARHHPVHARMGGQRDIARDLGFERRQPAVLTQLRSHAPSSSKAYAIGILDVLTPLP